ncbi:MAG TPA: zinc ribbon domain-containing protein [Candidatus Saccharimonadales bacterium]|nr:zinc ribbon domain-containing protein [Candidatus Saccharimonadales bacterium]
MQKYINLINLNKTLFDIKFNNKLVINDKNLDTITQSIGFLYGDSLNQFDLTNRMDTNITVHEKQTTSWEFITIATESAMDKIHDDDIINRYHQLIYLMTTYGHDFIWHLPQFDVIKKEHRDEIGRARYKPTGMKGIGQCPYCKSEEIYYQELQLRSLDEPMTILYRCLACDREWKK